METEIKATEHPSDSGAAECRPPAICSVPVCQKCNEVMNRIYSFERASAKAIGENANTTARVKFAPSAARFACPQCGDEAVMH